MVMRSAQTLQTWLLSLMPVLGPISPIDTLACSRGEAVHPGWRACSRHTNLASGRRHRVTGRPVPRAGYVARLTAAAERLPASAYLAPDEFKVLKRPAPDVHRQRSAYPKESSRSVPPHHGLPIQRPHRNLRPLCLSLEYSCPLCHSRSLLTSSLLFLRWSRCRGQRTPSPSAKSRRCCGPSDRLRPRVNVRLRIRLVRTFVLAETTTSLIARYYRSAARSVYDRSSSPINLVRFCCISVLAWCPAFIHQSIWHCFASARTQPHLVQAL